MILMYHKVDIESKSLWWVDSDSFYRQMTEISSKKIVYLDDYDPANPNHVVITFDGIYQNVVDHALPILEHFGYPFELFVAGNYIGKGNEFDVSEPYAMFADAAALTRLVAAGGRLQWHTSSHVDMGSMTDPLTIDAELSVPGQLLQLDPHGFRWFAYPNGNFCEAVVGSVRERFVGALSCDQGTGSDPYALNRVTVANETRLIPRTISVIVPSYNYGAFLREAIESVLRQTIPADEIIIADDCSDDNTSEIANYYFQKFPQVIHYFRNERNLGTVGNFNRAVERATGDYICIVGADNRILSNYLEQSAKVLDRDEAIAVGYTDYALFGPRAEIVYANYDVSLRKGYKENYYLVEFPEFQKVETSSLARQNIIHGSSMFRKKAFISVGGYRAEGNMPEDQNLFLRMLKNGWKAQKVHNTCLEYRQHSRDQLNERYIALNQLYFYKRKCRELEQRYDKLTSSRLCRLAMFAVQVAGKLRQRIMGC